MVEGRVLTVAGAKGGVGKTTTSINLGTALANAGLRVVVVETDLAMANVTDFLSFDRGTDLHDVLAGTADITEAIHRTGLAVDIVPSGPDLEGFIRADVSRLSAAIETLKEQYDLIVLDTGAGVSHESVLPLSLGDATILVSTPRLAAVRDTRKTVELAERAGGQVLGVVFCKSGTGRSPPVEHIADFLGVDLLGHVPEDPAVPASQDAGAPVVTEAPDSEAADAYRRIAGAVVKSLTKLPQGGLKARGGTAAQSPSETQAGPQTPTGPDRGSQVESRSEGEGGFEFVDSGEDDSTADDAGQEPTASEPRPEAGTMADPGRQSDDRGRHTGTQPDATDRTQPDATDGTPGRDEPQTQGHDEPPTPGRDEPQTQGRDEPPTQEPDVSPGPDMSDIPDLSNLSDLSSTARDIPNRQDQSDPTAGRESTTQRDPTPQQDPAPQDQPPQQDSVSERDRPTQDPSSTPDRSTDPDLSNIPDLSNTADLTDGPDDDGGPELAGDDDGTKQVDDDDTDREQPAHEAPEPDDGDTGGGGFEPPHMEVTFQRPDDDRDRDDDDGDVTLDGDLSLGDDDQEPGSREASRRDSSPREPSRQDSGPGEPSRQDRPQQDPPQQDRPQQDRPQQDPPQQDRPRQGANQEERSQPPGRSDAGRPADGDDDGVPTREDLAELAAPLREEGPDDPSQSWAGDGDGLGDGDDDESGDGGDLTDELRSQVERLTDDR